MSALSSFVTSKEIFMRRDNDSLSVQESRSQNVFKFISINLLLICAASRIVLINVTMFLRLGILKFPL